MKRTHPRQAMSPRQVDRMEVQVKNLLRIAHTRSDGRLQRLRAGLQELLAQVQRSERR